MDIYVVLDGSDVIGASARLQGAELIKANYERHHHAVCRIVNTELQDTE
jgi:hypothetical protein